MIGLCGIARIFYCTLDAIQWKSQYLSTGIFKDLKLC